MELTTAGLSAANARRGRIAGRTNAAPPAAAPVSNCRRPTAREAMLPKSLTMGRSSRCRRAILSLDAPFARSSSVGLGTGVRSLVDALRPCMHSYARAPRSVNGTRDGGDGPMRLEGKKAVITGGARGIGLAIGERYAREGARVILADRLLEQAEQAAKRIGPAASAVAVDVLQRESIKAMAKTIAADGGPDILVNAAAVFDMSPLDEISEDHFDKQFDINVRGLLFVTQAVSELMIAAGKGGKIINFSSQAGRRGEARVAVYCATKAAVISLTQSFDLELIKHRINVNAIAPG